MHGKISIIVTSAKATSRIPLKGFFKKHSSTLGPHPVRKSMTMALNEMKILLNKEA